MTAGLIGPDAGSASCPIRRRAISACGLRGSIRVLAPQFCPEVTHTRAGVDSSVVAALLHRAIGTQLSCVFVDHGLLRHGEGDQVMETFAQHMGVRVIRVDAADRFFAALAEEEDPERKRKIIGRRQDRQGPRDQVAP